MYCCTYQVLTSYPGFMMMCFIFFFFCVCARACAGVCVCVLDCNLWVGSNLVHLMRLGLTLENCEYVRSFKLKWNIFANGNAGTVIAIYSTKWMSGYTRFSQLAEWLYKILTASRVLLNINGTDCFLEIRPCDPPLLMYVLINLIPCHYLA